MNLPISHNTVKQSMEHPTKSEHSIGPQVIVVGGEAGPQVVHLISFDPRVPPAPVLGYSPEEFYARMRQLLLFEDDEPFWTQKESSAVSARIKVKRFGGYDGVIYVDITFFYGRDPVRVARQLVSEAEFVEQLSACVERPLPLKEFLTCSAD